MALDDVHAKLDGVPSLLKPVLALPAAVAGHQFSSTGDRPMSIELDLTPQELAAIKRITQLENDADAAARAAREFLGLTRLRVLKAVSGKVEFEDNWQEFETLDLGEADFPV
jgi:hypothetical protein